MHTHTYSTHVHIHRESINRPDITECIVIHWSQHFLRFPMKLTYVRSTLWPALVPHLFVRIFLGSIVYRCPRTPRTTTVQVLSLSLSLYFSLSLSISLSLSLSLCQTTLIAHTFTLAHTHTHKYKSKLSRITIFFPRFLRLRSREQSLLM